MTKETETKAPAIAPHDMWVYGPDDAAVLLSEGDEIPAGHNDAPKNPPAPQN